MDKNGGLRPTPGRRKGPRTGLRPWPLAAGMVGWFKSALLLLGVEAVRRHWLTLAVIGAIWAALGLGIIIDPLDGVQDITIRRSAYCW